MHMCLYNERYTSNKTIYVSIICTCVCTMKDIHQIKLWEFHMHMCLYNERFKSNKTIYVSFICTCVCTMKDIHQVKLFM